MIVCFLGINTAYADVPRGKEVKIDNEPHRCYTLEEVKKWVTADLSVRTLETQNRLFQDRLFNLEEQIDTLERSNAAYSRSIGILTEENGRLFRLWQEENKKRHEAENRPRFGNPIAWSIAGILAVTTGSLATALIVD